MLCLYLACCYSCLSPYFSSYNEALIRSASEAACEDLVTLLWKYSPHHFYIRYQACVTTIMSQRTITNVIRGLRQRHSYGVQADVFADV